MTVLDPPQTPSERRLAEIWTELLGVAPAGAEEDFFAAGGDSIQAAALVARACARFGVELPIGAFVSEPTIAALGRRIEQATAKLVPWPEGGGTDAARCSYAQERFWFIDQVSGASAVSNVSWALRLRGPLDLAALERALTGLALRHDTLRTRFELRDGAPVQIVDGEPRLTLEVVEAGSQDEATRLAAAAAQVPFDLGRGPLLRVRLLRIGPEDHVIQFVAHHIICDDWSKGVIQSELAALYSGLVAGEEPALAPPAIQYPDYSRWQRGWLSEEVLARELEHWRAALSGVPAAIEIPADRRRPPTPSLRGARLRTTVPPALAAALRALGRSGGATFFMTMLAALEAFLHRYTTQDEFVVGTAIDNRGRLELEHAIGLFTNVLALRADLTGAPSFRELLVRARAATLDAVAHQALPFDRLAAAATDRDPSRHPVYQVFYEFIVPAPLELALPGVRSEPFEVPKRTSEFDLGLYLDEQRGGLDAVWEYSSDLFEPETIERMAAHFMTMLEALVAHPDRPVAELPLLREDERRGILADWNATEAPVPDACLHELFARQARSQPDRPALIAGEESLHYGELNARANRIAHLLAERGVAPGEAVGLCLERSADLIAAMLGILKAGAAYVPLHPDHPAARLVGQLQTAGARMVIAQAPVAGFEGELLSLAGEADRLAGLPDSDPEPTVAPEDTAYVLYTSGSTGTPKGVAVSHRNLVNYTSHMVRALGASGLHFGSVSAVSTDLGNTAIFPALAGGGCLHLIPTEVATDGAAFAAYVARKPLDVLKITPSHLGSLLDAAGEQSVLPRRWLVLGGEALSWELAQRLSVPDGPRVINHYGPTEATIGCCTYELDPAGPRPPSATVPIGRPISNATAYLLDSLMEPVPVGVPGQLYVGGAGVARGYVGQPEQTRAAFLPDPFSADPQAHLYRTGDLARRLPDGSLEFLGRADEQVKIRGFRVEPAEVQAVLLREPPVRQAAVVAVGDGEDKRLVAYVVADRELVGAEALQAALARTLPAYMVPSQIALIDRLPLTPNGKLDRAALPSIEHPAGAGEARAEPLTEAQAALATIWEELLEHEIGIDENFFEAGGHSLLAIRLIARIRNDLGLKLTLKALIDAPTVRQLAERVEGPPAAAQTPPAAPKPAVVIARAPRDGALRCSFAQEQFWLVDQLTPGSPAYNFSWPVRLDGPLKVEALRGAVTELVRRHEALRTRFQATDGQPMQIVERVGAAALEVLDLEGEPDPEESAHRLIDEHTATVFDLARGPLLRVILMRLAEQRHILQIVVHHIVFDGVSKVVLYRELGELYDSLAAGRTPALAEPQVQYGDYAEWQRTQLDPDALERELAHWREVLKGVPTALDLPTDRPRPAVATLRGARLRRPLSKELRASLESLAKGEGATFFMAVLAAFEVLLYRYTGQEDLLVGTPVDTRTERELEQVIGPFINTVVVRGDLSEGPSFRELLGRVKLRTLDAIDHQGLPFERLVAAIAPERDLSRHPLFQALLALNPPESALRLSGLSVRDLEPAWSGARVDLFLILDDLPQGLEAIWEYSTDLFEPDTIERMSGHFMRLLGAIVADPDRPIDDLVLLGDHEQQMLLEEWNRTDAEFPAARLEQLIGEQARLAPDRVAVEFDGRSLTYGELEARANQLAHRLRSIGVGPDDLVGVRLDRSEQLPVALLGVFKSGAAYVPIDPGFPQARQEFMLEDAQVKALITDAWLAAEDLDTEPAIPPEVNADAAGLAYVIYTSGSTGKPKGVEVPHSALVNFLWSMRSRPGMTASDVLVAVTTLSFDIAGLELYLPLLTGARVVIASAQTAADPRALARLLDSASATALQATPTTWRMLVDSGWQGRDGLRALCGGEALPPRLADELLARGVELWNMYGPTETTIWSTCSQIGEPGLPPTIGRPIANTTLYVLDRRDRPAPVGLPGELLIGGAGVARGYRNRPDLTAERFIEDPFSGIPGSRMYRTGDLARYRADGTVEFLGRLDHQVKLRGFRIELGEIEAALEGHEAVNSAAVAVRDGARGEPSLVAYVVADDGRADPQELRRFLGQSLPAYMIPSAVMVLDEFPLTPNGKVDRRALPAPELAPASHEAFVHARTATEQAVAALFSEVLGVEHVSADDDFFSLGGQSLLAARLISRLDAKFEVNLPLRALFETTTVAGLAATVDGLATGTVSPPELPGAGAAPEPELQATGVVSAPESPAPEAAPLLATARTRPASFAQERFWFIDQVSGGSAAYNISWPLRLRGSLDVVALERALNAVVRRHEILRTHFAVQDGRPMQVIEPSGSVALEFVELTGEGDLQRFVDARTQAPFALSEGPLIRASLLRLAPEDHVLQVVVHHAVADGWSKVVLFRELAALYGAYRDNRPASLPEPPLQYADFAQWQRSVLHGERLERELAHWSAELAGIPTRLELPADHARPEIPSLQGGWLRTSLRPETVERLNGVARDHGATLFMVMLAAFDVLLYRYSGQEDVVVGTPVDTRGQAELEQLIGPFVNTLVLRTDLSGSPTFAELLARVKQRTLDAIEHQELPFERLVEALAPERELSRHPLFQALIALNPPEPRFELPGLEVTELDTEKTASRVDLTLLLQQHDGGLEAVWEYSSDLFERDTAQRIADHYLRLLDAVTVAPDTAIDDLPLLGERERSESIGLFASGARSFPVFCLHERFEEQARRTPEAVAVVHDSRSLSYRELNERANRLAHRLRDLGVEPDALVALCLERSLEQVVSVLAVLKAGGAYVPLDPEYPPERLEFVLRDSGAAVLVTQERLLGRFGRTEAAIVCVDRDAAQLAGESAADLLPSARPENLAYVIYTSGSTGQPKGVLVEHQNVARLFSATDEWFSPGESDGWTLLHSYAFDFSVWEIWGALLHGGRLVVVPEWTARSPDALAALLARERVTVLNVTPSLFMTAMDELVAAADELTLRFVIFGGEALHTRLLAPWFAQVRDDRPQLVNMYGITETTVHVTYRPLSAADAARDGSPIGVPIPDLQLYVLDPKRNPVPPGVAGELFVGGAGVARGYLNRPELTEQRFIASPFGPGRLYRTGDRARWSARDGLMFEGRLDDQVKIRGFRIELGEVQAALAGHEAVSECAVVATAGGAIDTRLAAYVVPDEDRAPVVRRLLELERSGRLAPARRRELPGGMVVAHLNQGETDYLHSDIFSADRYLQHGVVVPEDACVFDIGANIGMFALRVAAASERARIFAFEPIPPVFELLQLNAELHGLDVVLFGCGVGASESTATFTYMPSNSLISGRFVDVEGERDAVRRAVDDLAIAEQLLSERGISECYDRPVTTVSSVISKYQLERIDLLKIDAENSEREILDGIADADWPRIQQLVVEVHSTGELARELELRGFTVVVDSGHIYARRGQLEGARRGVTAARQSPAALSAELRSWLRERLPEYMVPSSVTLLEALPLTRNGKLDRRALPAPAEDRSAAEPVAPRTQLEHELAEVWIELLGVERVGIEDDFFDLGGHSLLAAQLAARVRARFASELSVRTVFEHPTIAGLARELSGAAACGASPATITRRSPGEPWPLSHSQQQLWLIDQWDPGAPTYNVPLAFRVRGALDLDALRAAVAGVLARHEALRTVVNVRDDHPVPHLLERPSAELETIDLIGAPEDEALRMLTELARRPFDFSSDPLLRCAVIQIADDDQIVLLETHHIAFDGISEQILLNELAALYSGRTLPEPQLQFGDFAVWQRNWLSSPAVVPELNWWRRHLAGAPTAIELPADRPRPEGRRFTGAIHDVVLPGELAADVQTLCRQQGVTPYMLVLAALGTVLYRITGQDDVLVGSPAANRSTPELEALIGFCSNTLVFRVRTSGDPTFRELLGRVREMALDVYAHQGIPFEKIVEAVGPEREPGVNPLFQVNLRVSTATRPALELPELQIDPIRVDIGLSRFDLALDLEVREDRIAGYFRYNGDIFDPGTIARIAEEFATFLRLALNAPDRRLLSFELVHDWNARRPAAGGLRGFRARARGGGDD